MATTYKDSGVDVEKGKAAVESISEIVKQTFTPNVLTGLGLFGSLFDLTDIVKNYEEPVLVQSIDGVGTKLEVAGMMNMYAQAGRDIVAHSCNDVLCQGAVPLTFLDYVATDQLEPEILQELVRGMAEECAENGLSLVGGETAEMPGTYNSGSWDVAGAVTGVVEKSKLLDGSGIQAGDVVIGLSSMGLHTNGFSLARKVLFEMKGLGVRDVTAELPKAIGASLMEPHQNYTKHLVPVLQEYDVHGLAHITGGGLVENIPRILPPGLNAEIKKGSWDVLPIFEAIQHFGDVPEEDMYITFNMGIGMVAVVPANIAEAVMENINQHDDVTAYTIGSIVEAPNSDTKEVCFV